VAAPTITTIKKLFSLAGNQCAFPGCRNRLVDALGALIGEVCHICADKLGGKRYDPRQTEAERQALANLIVLCPNHHTVVDSDDTNYTVAALREMKRQHEAQSTKPFVISDDLAARIVAFMAGATAASALGEIAREIGGVIKAVANALPSRKKSPKEKFIEELLQTLRFAPKGVIQHFAADPAHLELAAFFSTIFKASGWRDLGRLEVDAASKPGPRPELVLVFSLPDPHQVSNAKQAIDEVFAKSGFVKARENDRDAYESAASGGLRVVLVIGTRR
jgi:hypothetical protein